MNILKQTRNCNSIPLYILIFSLFCFANSQVEEPEAIDSDTCVDCHEFSSMNYRIQDNLYNSIHADLECQDCHGNMNTYPHATNSEYLAGNDGCRSCHEDEAEDYTMHGRDRVGESTDIPNCASCHGDHNILPQKNKNSSVQSSNLRKTCGKCHENLDLIKKYELLSNHPIKLYENSVHGKTSEGGIYVAANCRDCHASEGNSHKIYSPNNPESSINHFTIPETCGKCHRGIKNDYLDGIHGQLVKMGNTDAPVCIDCHGEHGILSPSDPRSPVSKSRVAESTCTPCHESTRLNEKYGVPTGQISSFIDSYHGLKSKSGDTKVANCGSCHGVHRILPSSDPTSRINPVNLQTTCGECHPGISAKLASTPIHGKSGVSLMAPIAQSVQNIYLLVIIIIIGLMVLHWILDLYRQIRKIVSKPQVIRMNINEVIQHTFLMLSFIVLAITGFALKFSQSWFTKLFFGFEGGFEMRGDAHRISAVVFILTVLWHVFYLIFSKRGKQFLKDMWPVLKDFTQFYQKILYYIGIKKYGPPKFDRFSYVEKAEYWALVWGTIIMIPTGILLWFDNTFVKIIPKSALDVALVVHYMEAWLATLAILVWHLYSTVFSPDVYPMNPSWFTGKMPDDMYQQEHPAHIEKARKETREEIRLENITGSQNDDQSSK